MSYESEFTGFMPATLTHKPIAGVDSAGVVVYSSSRTITGRVEMIHQRVLDLAGNERVSDITVFLKPTDNNGDAVSIEHKDYLALTTDYTTEIRPILRVERADDDEGLHHWEVLF